MLGACGSRPQSELTYTRDVAAGGLSGQALPRLLSQKVASQKDREKARQIGLTRLGNPRETATMGFGFVGQSSNVFQIMRDGHGTVYPVGKNPVELSHSEPRIAEVFLAGPKKRRIIGASHRGSQMSWNGSNFNEQLVLFPQQSTFGRQRAYDVAATRDASSVIVAMEGGLLYKISLRSGDVISKITVKGDQPRRILEDTPNRQVVFGTNKGQVSIWSGGRIRKLYTHDGPVLDISASRDLTWIVSSAKDGTAIVYHRPSAKMVYKTSSTRAIFHTQMSSDGRFAYIAPFRRGLYPILFDTRLSQVHELPSLVGDWPEQVVFDTPRQEVLILTAQGSVKRIGFDPQKKITRLNGYSGPRIRQIHYQSGSPYLYWLNDEGAFQTVSATEGTLISSPLITDVPIADFDVSYNGRYGALLLESGQILRFELRLSKQPQYRFKE